MQTQEMTVFTTLWSQELCHFHIFIPIYCNLLLKKVCCLLVEEEEITKFLYTNYTFLISLKTSCLQLNFSQDVTRLKNAPHNTEKRETNTFTFFFFLMLCIPVAVQLLGRVLLFFDPMEQPIRLLCPWDFPGKYTGMGCHFILQGIFQTQGSTLHLLHCWEDSLLLIPKSDSHHSPSNGLK